MPVQGDVSRHYTHGGLIEAIRAGIVALGKVADTVTADDLAPVDEFHIGGRRASEEFLDQLGFSAQMHVVDVGCGLGGAARFVASRYGSQVTGIDLTTEYVETGNALCKWVAGAVSIDNSSRADGALKIIRGRNIMTRANSLTVTALSLVLLGIAVPTQAQSLKQQLVGTWTFVSSTTKLPDGSPAWGSNPKGLLIFTENGYFSSQIVRSDLPKFASKNRAQGNASIRRG
jgi:SAM-dependent methyltransferase